MTDKRSTHLRIDFQVREIPEEGSSINARFITFGDDISMDNIRDFFDRCGHATDTIFNGGGPARRNVIKLKHAHDIVKKVELIKLVRQWANLTLKEAKDLVEQPAGSALVLCKDSKDADLCVSECKRLGIDGVEAVSVSENTLKQLVSNNVPKCTSQGLW